MILNANTLNKIIIQSVGYKIEVFKSWWLQQGQRVIRIDPGLVQAVRNIQNKRFATGKAADIVCNADMRIGEIRKFCQLQDEGQGLMRAATWCCA